jgi:tetraacyldisaccharide 4'-kinase
MNAHRPWARPLVPIYAAALRLKDLLRREPKTLAWPVISVGSVSAGGAGKTPVVIALAKMLQQRGHHVDVLSRGYGRIGTTVEQVKPSQADAAARFGDEPVLIEQAANVPVFVGADRYAAGELAERLLPAGDAGTHILDDGFQHRQLVRAIDLALLTAEDIVDTLLPAGTLREPLAALARADILVIREDERAVIEPHVARLKRADALVWSVHRTLRFPAPLGVLSAGLRPLAFCAIARPQGFAAALNEAGCGILDTVTFDDHAHYRDAEVEQILTIAKQLNASGFITTEKDAVKLTPALRAKLEDHGPLVVVALVAEFLYPERTARELEARLA